MACKRIVTVPATFDGANEPILVMHLYYDLETISISLP